MLYIWLAVLVGAVVVEAATVQMVAIWFAPSALVAMLLDVAGTPEWLQIVIFILLSAVFVVLFYGKLKKNISDKSEKTNIDAIIGMEAIAEDDFKNGCGRVKVKGMSWQAVCEGEILKDDKLMVDRIDGVTLKCSSKNIVNAD